MKKLLLAVSLLFCGCEGDDYTNVTPNQPNSISKPGFVAQLSDGRKLYRVIVQTNGWSYNHVVYFFNKNDKDPVTINQTVDDGEDSSTNITTVIIPE